MENEKFYLRVWEFTPPKGDRRAPVNISAIFEMTEAEARERLKAKGLNLEGWTARLQDKPVMCQTVVESEKPQTWRVSLERTQTTEIDVEARSTEEAIDLAWAQADDADWDNDGQSADAICLSEEA